MRKRIGAQGRAVVALSIAAERADQPSARQDGPTVREVGDTHAVSTTTEIIAVSSTAVLGVGTLISNAFGAWSRRHWEASEERKVEIRELLDQAGTAVSGALREIDEAWDNYRDDPDADADVRSKLDTLWHFEDRLAVRLGPDDEIVKQYETAHTSLRSASMLIGERDEVREFNAKRKLAYDSQRAYFHATRQLLGAR